MSKIIKLLIITLVISVFIIGCNLNKNQSGVDPFSYSQYQGNPQHSGEFYINKDPKLDKILWERKLSSSKNEIELSSPVANKNTIFIAAEKYLFAFDFNGKLKWKADLNFNKSFNNITPAVYKNLIFLGNGDIFNDVNNVTGQSNFYAIEAKSGKIRWINKGKGPIVGSPLAYKDKILFIRGKTLNCVNYINGKIIWESKIRAISGASPAFDNGNVYINDLNSNIYSFNFKTGKLIWRTSYKNLGDNIIPNKNLYSAGYDKLLALDNSSGSKNWEKTIKSNQEESFLSGLVLNNKALYFSDSNSNITFAYNFKGKKLWSSKTNESLFEPLIAGNKLIQTSERSVSIIDSKDGRLLRKIKTPDNILRNPFITKNGNILVVYENKLVCLN